MKTKFLSAIILASAMLAVTASTQANDNRDAGVTAFSILGSSPFAHQTYGTNVVRGEARLAPRGRNATRVVVTIDGLKPGTTHIGHIHGGTCAQLAQGTILHDLEPIVIDASGKGSSKTDIAATLAGFKDCEWWVAVHEGPANATPQTPAVAIGPVLTRAENAK